MGRRARTTLIATLAIIATLATFAGGAWWWANHQFNQIPTFDEPIARPRSAHEPPRPPEPAAEGITTVAVFSVGSDGVTTDEAERLRIGADRLAHSDGLTDSIALVVIDATNKHVTVLSLPRDTWSDTHNSKINAVYSAAGPAAFTAELESITGIRIDHMIAANFSAVADTVDALGGLWASTRVPVRDHMSGLYLDGTCTHLDGADALAWSRARHLEYRDGDRWRRDHTGDLGRMERQQQLASAIISTAGWLQLTGSAPALLDAAAQNLTRDDQLTLGVLTRLGVALRGGATLETVTPDAEPGRRGRASIVTITATGTAELAELAARVAAGNLTAPAHTDTDTAAATPTTTPVTPASGGGALAPDTTVTAPAPAPAPSPADHDDGNGDRYTTVTLSPCEPARP